MLAASARAEVQRRLRAIGVRRAVGASRGHLALAQAFEALFVAAPAATVGAVGGVLATYGPTTRLLVLLNEPAPGAALLPALVAAWLARSRSRSWRRRGRPGGQRAALQWRCFAESSSGAVTTGPDLGLGPGARARGPG